MLSLAKSRYTLLAQFVFLATNALGLLLGTIYNAKTPDLYPNNAHHKIGWIITWLVSAHVLISLLGWVSGAVKGQGWSTAREHQAFMPLSTDADADHSHQIHDNHHRYPSLYRNSNDSGQGTEPNTESLRNSSVSSLGGDGDSPLHSPHKEYDDQEDDDFEAVPLHTPARAGAFAKKAAAVVSSRVWKYLDIGYKVIDRIILPFGFVALATGVLTFGRFFVRLGLSVSTRIMPP